MKYSTKLLSQSLIKICKSRAINHIIISPGSRNAPLTIGFSEIPYFKCYSIVDERCAAFFALGIAQQLQEPVAIVCTSGSALLNYYPAIAESFYSDIPLLVISADRPKELINIGDGQTILQENVFSNHILYSVNCTEDETKILINEQEISKAIDISIEQLGPVHINIPFSEPLYDTTDRLLVSSFVRSKTASLTSGIDTSCYQDFLNHWNNSRKKMILVGVLHPNSIDDQILLTLAKDQSTIVLTETTSNLYHKNYFSSIDQLIAPLDKNAFQELQPDILLTFGGMIISKKIKVFLRSYKPKYHAHIDTKKAYDTYFSLNHHFKYEPNIFLKEFLNHTIKVKSDYQKKWLLIKEHRLRLHNKYVNNIRFSDFKVYSEIVKLLPSNIQLQVSNSSAIRYIQLFTFDKSIQLFCNRGTSGIDGSTSTAIGAASVSNKPTILITGDLSFFYDSNAFWNNYIPDNFKVIIINNSGGGIFRILPGEKDTENFDTFFETKHKFNASQIAKMYQLDYFVINDEKELSKTLKYFFNLSNTPAILEIFTPANINDKILLDYFNFIK